MREHFVVSSIRSLEVAPAERSSVQLCEDALKALDFGNSLLGVHAVSISTTRTATVKRSGTCISCLRELPAPSGRQRLLASSALPKWCEEYHLKMGTMATRSECFQCV
jgi:hypothetical protein